MSRHSDTEPDWDKMRDQVIGLGKLSLRKNHYALLRDHVYELERFRELLDCCEELILIARKDDGRIVDANGGACRALAYTREELLSMTLDMLWSEYTQAKNQGFANLNTLGQDAEVAFRHKDGQRLILEGSLSQQMADGLVLVAVVARDVTERKKADADLRASESRFRSLTQMGADWYWEQDAEFRFTNQTGGGRYFEYFSPSDPIGKTRWEMGYWGPAEDFWETHRQMLERHEPYRGLELRRLGIDGEVRTVIVSGEPVFDESGQFTGYRGVGTDITQSKQAEALIWRQANFDPLTDLPNRRMFHDRLLQEIKKVNRGGNHLVLLFIDLDHFKEVNDAFGHAAGDLLLTEAAARIAGCVREVDTVARLGGDEFTVLISGLNDINCIERIVQDILSQLAKPFCLSNEVVLISGSIGITFYPRDAQDVDELLRNADQAMYVAKNEGRNRFSYFTPALQEQVQKRIRLINDLRGALAGGQMRVYFQAIVDLSNGQIYKAEALLRWLHPLRGMVSPAEFIPLAEETRLIIEIGDWVFNESAAWVKRWRTHFMAHLQVSVNQSPVQFAKNNSNDQWLAYLHDQGLPGEAIVIEITESLLLDSDAEVKASLLKFRGQGVQIAIDDFGTGYSSLSYLKKFSIDYLKIDQSFIRNLAPGSSDMALTEAIIVMAHKLGLKVIAEGVETIEQRDLLIGAGCDFAQGYLFSKPVPPEEFELLIQAGLKSYD